MVGTAAPKGFQAQLQQNINGVPTEFVFHKFANKWFVLITQYGRVANMYGVEFDLKREDALAMQQAAPVVHPQFHRSVEISLNCRFGADSDETRSGIQFLVNKTNLYRCPGTLLVSLGLKKVDGPTLQAVAEVVNKIVS